MEKILFVDGAGGLRGFGMRTVSTNQAMGSALALTGAM
jgi:hypothetical protein